MNQNEFQYLVTAFCSDARIGNAAQFLDDRIFLIGGRPACLEYLNESGQILLSIDLGAPDDHSKVPLMLGLLEHGFDARLGGMPFYSLHGDSGRVVACQIITAQIDSGKGLLEAVEALADDIFDRWDQLKLAALNRNGS
jgi:hypothetical protein